MRSSFHIFVYGTLRSGGAADSLLRGARLVGSATVPGILYNIDGDYPALIIYGSEQVAGEVWECPAELLLRLDEYEGVPEGLFRRIGVEARLSNGHTIGCWTYAAGPRLSRKLIPANRVDEWLPGPQPTD